MKMFKVHLPGRVVDFDNREDAERFALSWASANEVGQPEVTEDNAVCGCCAGVSHD